MIQSSQDSAGSHDVPVPEKKKGRSPLQRARKKAVPTSVYRPWGDDLRELRKIVGWTQVRAYETIIGGFGGVRWAQWESRKNNHRPGRQAGLLILNWATNYNPQTREWALKMYQKETVAKLKIEANPELNPDLAAILGGDWKKVGE